MKKRFLNFLVALVLVFSINQTTASAAAANYQMFATSSGFATYLNSITRLDGKIRMNFGAGRVYYYTLGMYAQSSYNENDHVYQTGYLGNGNSLISATLKCDAYWNVRLYDSAKNKKATVKLVTYNTGNGPCSVDALNAEHPNQIQPPSSGGGEESPSGGDETPDEDVAVDPESSECADLICECIENVGDSIIDSMDKNGNKIVSAIKEGDANIVTAINQNTDAVEDGTKKIVAAVNKVTDAVNDLHDEFKTDKNYKIKDLPSNLELEKPDQPTKKYEDKTKYFEDQGDGDEIGPMPDVIDVKDWDGLQREDDATKDEDLTLDNEMTKDNMSQDSEMSKDGEMTKDNFTKDNEMIKDNMSQDSEMSKDGEMSKDNMSKDSEMSKDNMSQDNEMTKDNMSNTEQYNQTHIYPKAPSMTQKDLE